MKEWDDPDYVQVLPDSVTIEAAVAGKSKVFSM
jgi:hypothetical protein